MLVTLRDQRCNPIEDIWQGISTVICRNFYLYSITWQPLPLLVSTMTADVTLCTKMQFLAHVTSQTLIYCFSLTFWFPWMTRSEFLLTTTIILSNQVFRIKEKYQLADYKLIQYQILQTYIIRIVWQTVRRITNEILEVRGVTFWYLEDIGENLNIVLFRLQQLHGHLLPWCQRFGGTRNGCTQRWDGSTRCVYKKK